MKTKYTASWGMHIAEMIFQTRSSEITDKAIAPNKAYL